MDTLHQKIGASMQAWFSMYTLLRSWWVIAFLFVCAIFYEQGLKGREEVFKQLQTQYYQLQHERQKALIIQKELKQKINSQSDSDYVELILMKELGVSPEGCQKAYFANPS